MGHKGTIASIYDLQGLSRADETRYIQIYKSSVENWLNENIFGTVKSEDEKIAKSLISFAQSLGVNGEKLQKLMAIFETGTMSLQQLRNQLKNLTEETLRSQIRDIVQEELKKVIKA